MIAAVTLREDDLRAAPAALRGRHARHRRRDRPRRRDRLRRAARPRRDRRARARAARLRERAARARSRACGWSARAPREGGVLSFVLDGVHPHDVGTILDQRGHRDPHRPPLRAAGDGALRRARDRARLARASTTTASDLDALVRGARRARARCFAVMSDLRELYQAMILDHNKPPRNFRAPERREPRRRDGNNPLCGDQLTVYLDARGRRRARRRLPGRGLRDLDGVGVADDRGGEGPPRRRGRRALRALPRAGDRTRAASPSTSGLGKLAVFSGVREFPMRVKCATLPWHTLRAALAATPNGEDGVSDERRTDPSAGAAPTRRDRRGPRRSARRDRGAALRPSTTPRSPSTSTSSGWSTT